MPRPLVSVALPVKNGLPHLKDAVAALCRQTYDAITLVVQDSASTDGSLDYLRSLETPFPVDLVSAPDPSLVAGYNRAFQRCTGDLVVAAACDEVLDDDAIERYVHWYDEYPEALFIYSGMRLDDGDGAPLREYQPLPFDFVDFLRHRDRIVPPMSGAFNRRLLGAELRFDESLATVPDFELLTRLALRFGPHRILAQSGMTATAKADERSMTYRPDAYRQFARDKTRIINQMLVPGGVSRWLGRGLAQDFAEFLQRDVLSDMHLAFARHIFGISGDCPEFREQILAASSYMPDKPMIEQEARQSRHFLIDPYTHALTLRPHVPPESPPENLFEVVATLPLDSIHVEPEWASVGSTQEIHEALNVVTTSAHPWSYSAWAHPDLPDLARDQYWYWLRIRVARAAGSPLVSLYDRTRNTLRSEISVPASEVARDYYLELSDDLHRGLLVRNGESPERSLVAFADLAVLRMPIAVGQAA